MLPTLRLYYDEPGRSSVDATVVRTEERDGCNAVWLDRTVFYPTSGGQPFDTGTINGWPVLDVRDDEDGGIVHVVEGPLPAVGQQVHGEVDWGRRFDHMQQHTGQHLLSAVIERVCSARTVSFHLGVDASTIDLDRELTSEQRAQVEREVNAIAARNLVVTHRYVSEESAKLLPLRKETSRTGTLRLVEIDGVDLSACGGTHVERTGAIGSVVIASWERFKGGQRLEFLCGGRVIRRFQQLRDSTAVSLRLLSVLPEELPAAIERLQGEVKEHKRTCASLQAALATFEAGGLAADAEAIAGARVVLRVLDADATRLKTTASAVVTRSGLVAALVSRSVPALVVVARAQDVSLSCRDVVSALLLEYGGKGGGKPDFAQAGGLQAEPDQILASVRALLASAGTA